MLRITIHEKTESFTFQLEGRLAGPWVHVLEECWQNTQARECKRMVRVDLNAVTSIDAAGKRCLESLHREGAEFIAVDCLTKAIVAEITHAPAPGCERSK